MVCALNSRLVPALAANEHQHRPVLGVVLKLCSVVLLSCLAACVKYLGDGVPTGQIIFVRGVISMAVLAFIAWHTYGFKILRKYGVEYCDRTVSMYEAAGRAVAKLRA